MPSLYIILDKKIPGADTYVNGNFLPKHNDKLERMAKGLRVTPLMNFFSISKGEMSSLADEYGIDLDKSKPAGAASSQPSTIVEPPSWEMIWPSRRARWQIFPRAIQRRLDTAWHATGSARWPW
jgi:hypothetical protein